MVISFCIAFFLACAIGANDVANSFGTTVGAKTISIRTACILATLFETGGAVLIGARVGETIRKELFEIDVFKDDRTVLMVGMLSARDPQTIHESLCPQSRPNHFVDPCFQQ